MENKNTIIAVVLMLVVWVGFSLLFPSPSPPPAQAPAPDATVGTPLEPETTVRAPEPQSPEATMKAGFEGGEVRDIIVENDVFRGVISTSGARLTALELKNYSVTPKDKKPIALVQAGPENLGTLRTGGVEGLSLSPAAVYSTEVSGNIRLSGGERRDVSFLTRTSDGLLVEKILTFYGDKYQIGMEIRLKNDGGAPLQGSLQVALVQPWDEGKKGDRLSFVGPTVLVGDKVNKIDVKDLAESPVAYGADVIWTGFVDKYFLDALVPLQNSAEKAVVEKNSGMVISTLVTPHRTFNPGEAAGFSYVGYFGPKDLDVLKAADHRLSEAIDFGFFSVLARPLLHVLKIFYSFLHNYGLAIILLTAIIKLIFWPLTQKSYKSMKSMQKLQPQMQKIREKYKNDRERLNKEIMELYKQHRVNPLGGCLPMVVQIPVFFALYKVLLNSIELRHAPFLFWIQDLSAKDPYYITPLIMGATMFIQQKMSPSNMDPNQAKILMLMPVIFTFMFLNFPSGLVIYWLVNNLLTIGQQMYINREKS